MGYWYYDILTGIHGVTRENWDTVPAISLGHGLDYTTTTSSLDEKWFSVLADFPFER